jgi:hypothetical protein
MHSDIKFEIKTESDICSLNIYRSFTNEETGNQTWSYIDSCHPMSIMELHTLKNFLQEYLHNNDWY